MYNKNIITAHGIRCQSEKWGIAVKKYHTARILLGTAICLGLFLLGFFMGRFTGSGVVLVQTVPGTEPAPVQLVAQTEPVQAPTEAPLPSETAPTEEATSDSETLPEQRENTEPGLININTASEEELDELPGIGPVLAKAIVEYREAYGDFAEVSELTLVSGIGEKKLEKLRNYATVGD